MNSVDTTFQSPLRIQIMGFYTKMSKSFMLERRKPRISQWLERHGEDCYFMGIEGLIAL